MSIGLEHNEKCVLFKVERYTVFCLLGAPNKGAPIVRDDIKSSGKFAIRSSFKIGGREVSV